jgi:hypothetical protein
MPRIRSSEGPKAKLPLGRKGMGPMVRRGYCGEEVASSTLQLHKETCANNPKKG